jgi:NADPH2:quinone reductase
MRAMLMTAVGGPEVFQLVEQPEPEITGEHDVRVRLRAAGINPVDYKLRSDGTIGDRCLRPSGGMEPGSWRVLGRR